MLRADLQFKFFNWNLCTINRLDFLHYAWTNRCHLRTVVRTQNSCHNIAAESRARHSKVLCTVICNFKLRTVRSQTGLDSRGNTRSKVAADCGCAIKNNRRFVFFNDMVHTVRVWFRGVGLKHLVIHHNDFIRGVVNSGFSGLLWAPEVRRVSSREELIRRIQSVVFSPQALINAWHIDRAPWLDYDVEDEVRRLFECRMQLVPYLYAAFYQYYKAGKAPVRALVSDYTDDPNTYTIDDEYLFGDGMLVAPIIAGEESRTVYLPQGTWYDFWTHKPYNAGYHEVRQEDIPVFVKENTVLPLARPVQYIEPDTKFLLDVVCFGKQGEITLVEDDGVTTGTVYKEHKLAFNGQSVVSLEENSRYEIAGTQFVR